ncbi:hypothetical protein LS482_11065 [Sinomicrobium kalidii]|uniref:hypothetical protein n=1 Tax=Sinomicrobium kalidii TaxID=2900738 RepID=UPI001E4B1972|nr:hypothetical protein [Sinomicrobium kalidii]UGU14253.1 hypothetical protein LS482_11065 [Sinomicrobium kalidii]
MEFIYAIEPKVNELAKSVYKGFIKEEKPSKYEYSLIDNELMELIEEVYTISCANGFIDIVKKVTGIFSEKLAPFYN